MRKNSVPSGCVNLTLSKFQINNEDFIFFVDFLENTNFNNIIYFWKLPGTKQAEDHPKIPENLKISWTQFITTYPLVVVTSSGILKEKQKLGITFNSLKCKV